MSTKILSRFADKTGDGSGGKNANENYSGAPQIFRVQAQPGEVIELQRMIVSVQDSGLNSYDLYTASAALTNGIAVYVTDIKGTTVYDLTDPDVRVKTLGGWAHYCYDSQILGATSGDDHYVARWTFARSGVPVVLYPGWSLCILCEDAMQALTEHRFLIQGKYIADQLTDGVYD